MEMISADASVMVEQDSAFQSNHQQGATNEAFELQAILPEDGIVCDTDFAEVRTESRFEHDSSKERAVWVRSAYKKYGNKKDPLVVLDGLNMTVPTGIIYGLLGASGCGKTTLLSCVLGLKTLNSGAISVLGRTVGSNGSGSLGSRVGYMPQEMALYRDFSIRETITFFGWIAGMTNEKIEERMEFLANLLHLPDVDQRVKNLSGGQQRRVSLATALLHEPELLILDEPTVGLDSVLRDSIWNHFSNITKEGLTTVIITTHYIDETRRAHCIALMRNGRLLAEDSPDKLLTKYGLETLESLFLKLSCNQDIPASQNVLQQDTSSKSVVTTYINQEVTGSVANFSSESKTIPHRQNDSKNKPNSFYKASHMKALFWKNFLWMIQHAPLVVSIFVSPFITIAIFWTCIGNYPSEIPVAVVNYETNNTINCGANLICNSSHLSCHYLKYIQGHNITLISYNTEKDARDSVLRGKAFAFITFKRNYSAALYERIDNWQASKSWEILYSEVDVVRDISYSFASYLKKILYDTFQDFLRDYMESCDGSSKGMNIPIRWEDPIYGRKDSTFSEFVITGLMILYICLLAAYVTVCTTMIERTEGLLERILVIGVNRLELITTHLICQFILIIIESVIMLACLFLLFNVTMKGSYLLVILLTLLSGGCGMFFGLCLSCACNTEATAAYIVTGSGFMLMVLSGTVWPLEGMHYILKPLATYIPFTQALESMRSVMLRGWGISTHAVYMGFVTVTMWTILLLILSILFLKFKKD